MKNTPIPALAASVLMLACGGGEEDAPLALARPVTLFALEESSPPPGRLVPGLVAAYRQTQIAFEVTGRVTRMIDVGEELLGEQVDRDGAVVQQGDVIAEIDPAPFQRALNRAQQRLEAAKRELAAQQVQLDTVLTARLESARAQALAAELNASYARDDVQALESAVELAQTTVDRNRELLPTGAVSDISVRQSETELLTQQSRLAQARTLVTAREREHDAAKAAIAEVQGNQALQAANIETLAASIEELKEVVADARSDLEDCVLRAPFPGRVTEQHVGEGSFVQAGSPVVTVTMMTPIEVEITASAEDDERLVVGTDAVIYPMNGNEVDFSRGVRATLYEKRGIADTSTRTFRAGLIAPNKRRVVREDYADLPRARYVIPVFDNPLDLPGDRGFFTLAESVGGTESDPWVLRVRGLSQGSRSAESLKGRLEAERLPVVLGERTIQVASFSLVELVECGDLRPGDLLVPEPTPAHESGFVVDDNRWLLRPGDLVQVSLDHGDLPSGFYVPVQAIRELNGRTRVFVVDPDDRARAVEVEVRESSGEMRRVVSDRLSAGDAIAAKGAHFLQDGDRVIRVGEGSR